MEKQFRILGKLKWPGEYSDEKIANRIFEVHELTAITNEMFGRSSY